MGDKLRWLLSELRQRSMDCFKEGEGVTVVVVPDRGLVFDAFRFERRWYLGSCARYGATYLVPDDVDVVAVCTDWVAGWLASPPPEAGHGAPAPPEVVTQYGLKRLSKAEVSEWFEALWKSALHRVSRSGDES